MTVSNREGRGLQKRFDRLARRIALLTQLVETLRERCKIQQAIIAKLATEDQAWSKRKQQLTT